MSLTVPPPSPQHYLNADIVTFTEVSKDPKGMEWLWNPQIVGIYNRLLQRCELNKHTTEAASGALQNITAGDRRVRAREGNVPGGPILPVVPTAWPVTAVPGEGTHLPVGWDWPFLGGGHGHHATRRLGMGHPNPAPLNKRRRRKMGWEEEAAGGSLAAVSKCVFALAVGGRAEPAGLGAGAHPEPRAGPRPHR